jgi:archaellum component FlaC
VQLVFVLLQDINIKDVLDSIYSKFNIVSDLVIQIKDFKKIEEVEAKVAHLECIIRQKDMELKELKDWQNKLHQLVSKPI